MAEKTYGQALGELILRKRRRLGLTQVQLAEDAYGTAAKTRRISELETGTVANPHPKTIDPVISCLKITDDELEECAKQARREPDPYLDRAYREARNLISALAYEFEHKKPEATLAEVEDYLKAKAKEWAEFRDRLSALDTGDQALNKLIGNANNAVNEGNFDEADELLSEAEQSIQKKRTIKEIRRSYELRIARADGAYWQRNFGKAKDLYQSAVEYFRPFDEVEMAYRIDRLAGRLYDVARHALHPEYMIPAKLLETALELNHVKHDEFLRARTSYRLGLVYWKHCERLEGENCRNALDTAIANFEISIKVMSDNYIYQEGDDFTPELPQLALANSLRERAYQDNCFEDIMRSIEILKAIRDNLRGSPPQSLLALACNNLGAALRSAHLIAEQKSVPHPSDSPMDAFREAISSAELLGDVENWAVAKTNIGALLAEQAEDAETDDNDRNFLRTRAIAEMISALEAYPIVSLPYKFADMHVNLARVFASQAMDTEIPLKEIYLMRSISSCEAACAVLTEETAPEQWAKIQMFEGSIYIHHSRIEGTSAQEHDIIQGIECYRAAVKGFELIGNFEQAAALKSTIDMLTSDLDKMRASPK